MQMHDLSGFFQMFCVDVLSREVRRQRKKTKFNRN